MLKKSMIFSLILSACAFTSVVSAAEKVAGVKGGDPAKIEFVLPFEKALAKAKQEKRLIFIKPIYGGVNDAGYKDYRCGSW